jgi:hypothetical protein
MDVKKRREEKVETTEKIARFVVNTGFEDTPEEAIKPKGLSSILWEWPWPVPFHLRAGSLSNT